MPDIIITPGSGLIDFYPSNKTASIYTSGNNLAFSNPSGHFQIFSGNLGINTSTPSGKLTVVGSGLFATIANPLSPSGSTTGIVPNALLHLYSATTGDNIFNVEGTNGSLFSVVDSLSGVLMSVNNNAGLPVLEVYSDDRIIGGRFNQNDFVLSSGGNLGLGIATASGKLHVVGNTIVSGNLGIGNTSPAYKLDVTGTGNFTSDIYTSGKIGVGISSPSGQLHVVGTGIVSTRLGIANNTPSYPLDVAGTGNFTGNLYASGNVGIGISTPSGALDVRGTTYLSGVTNTILNMYDNGASSYGSIVMQGNNLTAQSKHIVAGFGVGVRDNRGTNCGMDGTGANGALLLAAGGAERVRISTGGLVGIGLTNPAYTLDASGTGNFRGDLYTSGNIGIRTTSPSATLHVNGSGYFASGCVVTGVLNVQAVKSPIASGTDGATITFDMNSSNLHTVTLGGNRILAVSNVDVGQRFLIRLKQDNTPPRTVTWFSGINWPSDVVPTLTATSGAVDVFGFICTSGSTYDGFVIGYDL